MLFAAPFAAIGFVKYNGMPAEKFIVAFIRSQLRIPRVLVMKNGCYYYEEPQQKKKRPVPNREITFIKRKTKKKDKKRKEKQDD